MSNAAFPDGTRVRDRETAEAGTIETLPNGPDALDADDVVTVVDWDDPDAGTSVLRRIAHRLESIT